MPIINVEKNEDGLELLQDHAILVEASAPSFVQIMMEIECKECGSPVYISPDEKGGNRDLYRMRTEVCQ
jgi:hypothetical protein